MASVPLAGCLGSRSTPELAEGGTTRGSAAVVTANHTVTDAPGYEDGIEHFPDNDTVRYATSTSGGEPTDYETLSVAEWSEIRSTELAAERVTEAVTSELDIDPQTGFGTPPDGYDGDASAVAFVTLTQTLDRDGRLVGDPVEVSLDTLAEATPRTVDTTIRLDGATFTRTVPVFARILTQRYS